MHIVGTSAMLPLYLGAVVDFKLEVCGRSDVRVAYAFVVPIELTSHTTGILSLAQPHG
jgi:choline dehydrogenase